MLRVGVLIDLPPGQAYHVATLAAIDHAAHALGIAATACVLRTRTIPDDLSEYAAIVVGPGSPYDDASRSRSCRARAWRRCTAVPPVPTSAPRAITGSHLNSRTSPASTACASVPPTTPARCAPSSAPTTRSSLAPYSSRNCARRRRRRILSSPGCCRQRSRAKGRRSFVEAIRGS